jgi:hypothetical protein
VIQNETEKLPGYVNKAIFNKTRNPINITPLDKAQGVMAVSKSHTNVTEIKVFNEKFQ